MVVFIAGGLGNQMFEYAYARALQEQLGIPLVFNNCELYFHRYENREYSLNKLRINKDSFLLKNNYITYLNFKFKRRKYLRSRDYISSVNKNSYFDSVGMLVSVNTYSYYPHIVDENTKYMYGNFQSWKYFEKYDSQICKELRVAEIQNPKNKKIRSEMKINNSVCVHIRRGDYVNNSAWTQLNICNYNYYYKAMKVIKQKVENPVFYIFSNDSTDIEWIKHNYDFTEFNVKYVDLNNPDYEELRLMYSCKHFIISNSTFSWWAQHLGDYENKIVIAPSQWNKEESATDIYEKNWITIDV